MKKILFLLLSVCIISCNSLLREKKQYDFQIIYTNGDTIETSYLGIGNNFFSLVNGDLTTRQRTKTLVSGVRAFRILAIKNLGLQTQQEANTSDCELKQLINE